MMAAAAAEDTCSEFSVAKSLLNNDKWMRRVMKMLFAKYDRPTFGGSLDEIIELSALSEEDENDVTSSTILQQDGNNEDDEEDELSGPESITESQQQHEVIDLTCSSDDDSENEEVVETIVQRLKRVKRELDWDKTESDNDEEHARKKICPYSPTLPHPPTLTLPYPPTLPHPPTLTLPFPHPPHYYGALPQQASRHCCCCCIPPPPSPSHHHCTHLNYCPSCDQVP